MIHENVIFTVDAVTILIVCDSRMWLITLESLTKFYRETVETVKKISMLESIKIRENNFIHANRCI